MKQPSDKSLQRVRKLVTAYTNKSGTTTHPNDEVREAVELGLAQNIDEIGRPLCPCRFYPDKVEEIKHRTWVCPCDDMQVYKYCHCLLFVKDDGNPITEYLPDDHDGKEIYGKVDDPTPDKGRPLKGKAQEREEERVSRPS